jgi:hypothetical protein
MERYIVFMNCKIVWLRSRVGLTCERPNREYFRLCRSCGLLCPTRDNIPMSGWCHIPIKLYLQKQTPD